MNGLTVTVEQEFVEWANYQFTRYGSTRSNMDSLLLEWWLIKYSFVTPPEDLTHDLIVDNYKIDFKELRGKLYWTVKVASHAWMVANYNNGSFNNYLFYTTTRTSNDVLKQGDQVKFKFESFLDGLTALKVCNLPSNYLGPNGEKSVYCRLTSLQTASNMI